MKKLFFVMVFCLLATVLATPVLAQAPAAGAGNENVRWSLIVAGFAMAIASAVCGLAQSKAVAAACSSVARNPGAADSVRFFLILGLVLIESLALYTLLIVLKFTWVAPLY
ncbi:MAG: ATP synthase F0 subunit C [Acidobacteria bacterium]|nr:ATP synthase F0 subunit C [Acidobacteriota bacterium]MBI3656867.1 ATP synthase F0 subunit C [Acidobacteriota bacterium]